MLPPQLRRVAGLSVTGAEREDRMANPQLPKLATERGFILGQYPVATDLLGRGGNVGHGRSLHDVTLDEPVKRLSKQRKHSVRLKRRPTVHDAVEQHIDVAP